MFLEDIMFVLCLALSLGIVLMNGNVASVFAATDENNISKPLTKVYTDKK